MIYTLQGLRALAMLGIFLFHSGLLLNGTFPVTFFFILSGFVLYYTKQYSVENITFKQNIKWVFIKMRPFYVIHIITFFMSIIIRWDWINKLSTFELVRKTILDLLLIQSLFKNDAFIFNGLAWFLSVTFILYLVTIPIIKIIKKIPINKLIIYITLILIAQYALNIMNMSKLVDLYLYSNPIYRILDFILGMLTARMFLEKQINIKNYNLYEVGILVIFVAMYFISFFRGTACSYYSLLFIVALYVFSYEKGIVSKILSSEILQNIARISFEFYMIHELILIIFRKVFNSLNYHWLIKNIIICIPAFIISLIIARLMNKYIIQNIKGNYMKIIKRGKNYGIN